MKLEPALDPLNSGAWVLVEDTPDFTRYELDLGDGKIIRRTEHKRTDALLAANSMDLSANQGKRWGDGQVFGRVPLNIYYSSGLAEANKQGDSKFVSRWWNDSDNAKFRTFEGKV
ncbi:MAG: hypothetical protein ACE37E_01205 [Hyphomicrobiales bacterium]